MAMSLLRLLLVLGVLLRGLNMDMATRGLVWSRVLARLMVLVLWSRGLLSCLYGRY